MENECIIPKDTPTRFCSARGGFWWRSEIAEALVLFAGDFIVKAKLGPKREALGVSQFSKF